MKLSLRKLIAIEDALKSLDGYQKDGKTYPYTLSGTVRRIISKNLALIGVETAALEKARNDVVRSLALPDAPGVVAKGREFEFADQYEKMLDDEEDLPLRKLTVDGLGLDDAFGNPIPGSVLAALDPIIEDVAEPVQAAT